MIIKEFIVNLFFILLPIFMYYLFVDKWRLKEAKRLYFVGITSAIAIILCMTFPVTSIANGHVFDLRQIPLVISGIYGSLYILFINLAVLLGYRLYIGGEGAMGAIFVNSLLVIFMTICINFIKMNSAKIRMMTTIGLSLLGSFLTYFAFTIFYTSDYMLHVNFLFQLLIFQGLGIWMTVYIIEAYQSNYALKEKLQEAEKLKNVSELAASISHEVRNPLTVVKGFIQLLNQKQLAYEKQQDYQKICLQELDRAESIIKDYLNFANPRIEHNMTINIQEQLETIVNIITPLASKHNVEVISHFEHNVFIDGEPNLFRQCILNILKNGIEAIDDVGKIAVSTYYKNGQIVINISDSGNGMTDEQISRLGEPYFTSKENGTGLGLMVTISGIHALKGIIDVSSSLGQGTCFKISFPIKKTADETNSI